MGVLKTEDVAAEFRQPQPLRDLPFEHAALAPVLARAAAFAGNHQNELGAIALRLTQERKQRRVGLALGFAVKIDAASIASVPRTRRCLSRRSNASSGAVGLAAGGAERAGAREGFGFSFALPGAVGSSGSARSGCRRSGATERVIS